MTKKIIKDAVSQAEILLDAYRKELEICPPGHLAYLKECGKYDRYCQITKKNGKRVRIRINSKQALMRQLARKAFLEENISRLEKNTFILTEALAELAPCDAKSVMNALKKKYPKLPVAAFLKSASQNGKYTQLLENSSEGFAPNGISLKSFEWANEDYLKHDKPFASSQYTSRGLRVRSKNELFIAEKLYAHDIPFRYESVIDFGGNHVAPDFSFKNNGGHLGLWEHFGMMHDEGYQKSYYYKRDLYNDFGFFPWKNLFMSFSSNNDINIAEIDDIIKHRLLPWMLDGE